MSDYRELKREARMRMLVISIVLLYAAGCALSAALTMSVF